MSSLLTRLMRLEAGTPLPLLEPSGERREEEAIWGYLANVLLATMPERDARRVVAEINAGPPSSVLAERVLRLVDRAVPEPWTCSLSGCECGAAGVYEPLALPGPVCAALEEDRASYGTLHRTTCATCAYELPHPWADPCPVCSAPFDRRGSLVSPARHDWLAARTEALGRYSRREPLSNDDRYHLDRRGVLATLAGARAPGAPAPAAVAEAYGGAHTIRFDIRHPEAWP